MKRKDWVMTGLAFAFTIVLVGVNLHHLLQPTRHQPAGTHARCKEVVYNMRLLPGVCLNIFFSNE